MLIAIVILDLAVQPVCAINCMVLTPADPSAQSTMIVQPGMLVLMADMYKRLVVVAVGVYQLALAAQVTRPLRSVVRR